MSPKLSTLSKSIKLALASGLLAIPAMVQAEVSAARADLNDDGAVNVLDLYEIISVFGARRGESRYLEGKDFNGDGVIDFTDYSQLFVHFGKTGVSTEGTTLTGLVTDENGIPIEGVLVQLGSNTVQACSKTGQYVMDIGPDDFGVNEINFFGLGGTTNDGEVCEVQDATPGTLSGEYPTIPHKPIFINGGTDNVFRVIPLIERDHTGAVAMADTGANQQADGPNGEEIFALTQNVEVSNAGVSLAVAAGCNLTFPSGEPAELTITRVDAASLPVAQPPGINSSLWVTFQPGGTEINNCPDGTLITILLDNVDGLANASEPLDLSHPEQPQLYEVIDGAFQAIAPLTVVDADGNPTPADADPPGAKMRATIPLSSLGTFGFAWYGGGAPIAPCPATTLQGQVLLDDLVMPPIADATVTIAGLGVVSTDAAGNFSMANVPAHPNTRGSCFARPFVYTATVQKDLDVPADGIQGNETSITLPTPAVAGGITNMGIIKIGDENDVGIVKGTVRKLNSIDPFLSIPLPAAEMSLMFGGTPLEPQPLIADPLGNFQFNDVPVGGPGPDTLQLEMHFEGLLPPPGGGVPQQKVFDDVMTANLQLPGQILQQDFRQLGHGEVHLTVTDESGNLLDNIDVQISFPNVQFEFNPFKIIREVNGYRGTAFSCFLFSAEAGADGDSATAESGKVFFNENNCGNTIPMGECEIEVFGGELGFRGFGRIGPEDGCFINEHGQILQLDLALQLPDLFGDIAQVEFNQAQLQVDQGPPPSSIDVIEVRLAFSDVYDDGRAPFVEIHFDLDQNTSTGFNSGLIANNFNTGGISTFNFIADNIGADIRIICNDQLLEDAFITYGGAGSNAGLLPEGMCEGIDENGDVVAGLERASLGGPFEFEGDMILLIPKDPLVAAASALGNPDGHWDTVLETGFETDGYGGYGGPALLGTGGLRTVEARNDFNGGDILFDVVPNINGFFGSPEPPAEIDPDGNNLVTDQLGDFYCYFGFCDVYGGFFD